MIYSNLKFPEVSGRPFFYTNFVSTLDGKVAVRKKGYWPIGSRIDHQVLMELRAYADCLIHGKNLASQFGEVTLESLKKDGFKRLRKRLGKESQLPYCVAERPLKQMVKRLYQKGYQHILVEGGPTLLGAFLRENLLDEIFLTIAPKIFGSEKDKTLTLVEEVLFPPDQIKKLKLLSVKQIAGEVFLRYRLL